MKPSNWIILDRFKSQFHLAKNAANLISKDNFTFNLQFNKEKGAKANIALPQEEKISRFAVCVRPFANPSDPLNYKKIAAIIFELANSVIQLDKNSIEQAIKKIDNGPIGININNKKYSALDIFLIYSKGEYFEEDKEAAEIISKIRKNPIISQLTFYQFYNYSYDVFNICAYLYSLVRELEKKSSPKLKSKKAKENVCIFCRTGKSKFNFPEHIFPESLGNTEIILPAGYVCDECNNEVLSLLDKHLVEHSAISFLRVFFLPINTKTGKFPKAKYQNWKIEKTHPRKIRLIAQSGSKKSFIDYSTNEESKFTINTIGCTPFDPLNLARSLYKIALGLLCLEYGSETALQERYDMARDFILEKVKTFPNNLFISEHCKPSPLVGGRFIMLNPTGTISIIHIFGITFVFNLEVNPRIEMNEQLLAIKLKCFSLES